MSEHVFLCYRNPVDLTHWPFPTERRNVSLKFNTKRSPRPLGANPTE